MQERDAPLRRRGHEAPQHGCAVRSAIEAAGGRLAASLEREIRIEAVLQLATQCVHETTQRLRVEGRALSVEKRTEAGAEAEEQIVADLGLTAETRAAAGVMPFPCDTLRLRLLHRTAW